MCSQIDTPRSRRPHKLSRHGGRTLQHIPSPKTHARATQKSVSKRTVVELPKNGLFAEPATRVDQTRSSSHRHNRRRNFEDASPQLCAIEHQCPVCCVLIRQLDEAKSLNAALGRRRGHVHVEHLTERSEQPDQLLLCCRKRKVADVDITADCTRILSGHPRCRAWITAALAAGSGSLQLFLTDHTRHRLVKQGSEAHTNGALFARRHLVL